MQNWRWSWRQCSSREALGQPLRKVPEVDALRPPVSAGAASAGVAPSSRRPRVSERAECQAPASRRPPVSEPAARPTLRRRLGSEPPRIPQAHSPAGLQAAGLRARSLRAKTGLRAPGRPAASRTSRRKPRQVSPTGRVPPTSDFQTGSRCALAFRDLVDPTARRDSASPSCGDTFVIERPHRFTRRPRFWLALAGGSSRR
jgi:hypothetical protein